MNKIKLSLLSAIITVFVINIIGLAGPLFASDLKDIQPVAEVMIGSSGISWVPKINFKSIKLVVLRPDGSTISQNFASGSTPYIDISTLAQDYYLEGVYHYELRVTPNTTPKSRNTSDGFSSPNIANTSALESPLVQSGSFTLENGSIVHPNQVEARSQTSSTQGPGISMVQDQVFNDDVIIQFSLCVGTDCVNGENFGFDTIRLKENNLRIKFDDTSSSSGFPANDWEITINDSNSGGASYFAVTDVNTSRQTLKVLAGAPSNALVISSQGHLGLGTATPVLDIHATNGNTPSLRIEQDGTSGFTPQTWDIAGNEANFFIRDVTGGSRLPFRIRPGAPTSAIDISSSGKIGFGTASPSFAMELKTAAGTAATFVAREDAGASAVISADASHVFIGAKTNHDFRLLANDSPKMTILPDGKIGIGINTVAAANKIEVDNGARLTTGGTWTNASSRQYKENIHSLDRKEAFETLSGLNPVIFNYKNEKSEDYVGFIAEDVPSLVATSDRKGLSPMDVTAVLTKVVKEQQKTIQAQQEALAEHQKAISELKEKIDKVENQ